MINYYNVLFTKTFNLCTEFYPLKKMLDRLITNSATVSTLWLWSVAGNRCGSFRQIDGQVNNGRSIYFCFVPMNCCCWSICILSANWWTDRELKEWLFLLCGDGIIFLIDLCPLSKLPDRSRTEKAIVSVLWWWCPPPQQSASFE